MSTIEIEKEKQRVRNAAYRAANAEKIAAYLAANRDAIKARRAAYRDANREKGAAYGAANRDANRDAIKAKKASYYAANREACKAKSAAYIAANRDAILVKRAANRAANREVIKAKKAAYNAANREKRAAYNAANRDKINAAKSAYRSARCKADPNFKLRLTIRNQLGRIVRAGGAKQAPSMAYIGCTVTELRRHLERQFLSGMTWQNHGEWHIDHIIPLAAFDFAGFPAQIKQAQHYTNLRPMWAEDNQRKSDTLTRPVQLELIAA
jgi:hypothetical protein